MSAREYLEALATAAIIVKKTAILVDTYLSRLEHDNDLAFCPSTLDIDWGSNARIRPWSATSHTGGLLENKRGYVRSFGSRFAAETAARADLISYGKSDPGPCKCEPCETWQRINL